MSINTLKKKILFLGIKEYPYGALSIKSERAGGGTSKNAVYLARSLNILYNVDIICQSSGKLDNFDSDLKVHRVPKFSIRYFDFLIFHFLSFISSLSLLKRNKYDLIYTSSTYGIFFAVIISKIFKIPVIGMPRAGGPNFIKMAFKSSNFITNAFVLILNFFNNCLIWLSFPRLSSLVCLSDYETSQYDDFISTKVLKQIPNPIISRTSIKNKSMDSSFQYIYIGRLSAYKNLENLIEAFSIINNEHPKTTLTIIGSGEMKERLMYLVNTKKLVSSVNIEGFKKNIFPYLESSNILVLPSDTEGMPTVVLEAASVNVPSIVGKWGNDIFPVGVTHVLEDVTPTSIYASLKWAYDERNSVLEMGKAASKYFSIEYSFQNVAKKHINLVRENLKDVR